MKTALVLIASLAIAALVGCGGNSNIKEDPAALHGDYSGKDNSGSYAVIRARGNIPHVPESNGKQARYSQDEVDQILHFDADCQAQLYEQLPGTAQAAFKEGGWSAVATGIGEGLFAMAFPGAIIHQYVAGGAGIGAAIGANSGRYRQETSEMGALGYCMLLQAWDAKDRYHILEGINIVPWYGNGKVELPKAVDSTTATTLPHVQRSTPPPR
ncbi:MAG: hypothetical protein Q8P23_02700 [bacterium]|nr:hypothetical protein [bacterium]